MAVPKPYPEEFRQDAVRVAKNRGPGVTVEQVVPDTESASGTTQQDPASVSTSCRSSFTSWWVTSADVPAGRR